MATFDIRVTYQGPTDTRGARMIAKAIGKRVSVPYRYDLGQADRHLHAAQAFADKHFGGAKVRECDSIDLYSVGAVSLSGNDATHF